MQLKGLGFSVPGSGSSRFHFDRDKAHTAEKVLPCSNDTSKASALIEDVELAFPSLMRMET